jgi:WD40 repeat protein
MVFAVFSYGFPEIEFSENGTLLASGGVNKITRLWPISRVFDNELNAIAPIETERRHKFTVRCLSLISDHGDFLVEKRIKKCSFMMLQREYSFCSLT